MPRRRSPSSSRSRSHSSGSYNSYRSPRRSDSSSDNGHSHGLLKTSVAFLASIAAASLCVHRFWPKGIIHGEKEAWEVQEVKKVKRKLHDQRDRLHDRVVPGPSERARYSDRRERIGRGGSSYDDRGRRDDDRYSRRQERDPDAYSIEAAPPRGYVEYNDRRSRPPPSQSASQSRYSYDEPRGNGRRERRQYEDDEDDRRSSRPPRRYSVDDRRYDDGQSAYDDRRTRRRQARGSEAEYY